MMRQRHYYLKVEAVRPNIELFWAQVDQRNDAFLHHVHMLVETDQSWRDDGFMLVARRRISIDNNDTLVNARDQFPRRVIVRILDEGQVSTPETRQHGLNRIQQQCMMPANNKYGYEYIIDDASDLTPDDPEHYVHPDTYLQDSTLINMILGMYEDAGPDWYSRNKEIAKEYWTGPLYPTAACDQLGYPHSPPATSPHSTKENDPQGNNELVSTFNEEHEDADVSECDKDTNDSKPPAKTAKRNARRR